MIRQLSLNVSICMLSIFLLLNTSSLASQVIDPPSKEIALEQQIKALYPKLIEATVTVDNATGVLISEDGYILTAAHVIRGVQMNPALNGRPVTELRIVLSDGVTYMAKILGRNETDDYTLLKINADRKFPFIKMGTTKVLAKDEACLMLGHPQGLQYKRPAEIRLGFIKGFTKHDYLYATSTMMPGDSGGPLFNLNGELIGLSSYCWEKPEFNYFVPIDKISETWEELVNGVILKPFNRKAKAFYKTVDKEPLIEFTKDYVIKNKNQGLADKLLEPLPEIKDIIVSIFHLEDSNTHLAQGTILNKKGLIATKLSLINENEVACKLNNGKIIKAKVVLRNEGLDIAILKLNKKLPGKLKISPIFNRENIGDLTVSPGYNSNASGVISVLQRKIPKLSNGSGRLGFRFSRNEMNIIEYVTPKSNAEKAGIVVGDKIIAINGKAFDSEKERKNFLMTTKPNQILPLSILRGGTNMNINLTLQGSSKTVIKKSNHPAYMLDVSQHKDGFDIAFTHDSNIKPEDCGSPVINIKGEIIGINIARYSRTSSFAVPIKEVLNLVSKDL